MEGVTTRAAPAEKKLDQAVSEHHPDDLARIQELEAKLKASLEEGQTSREELAAAKAALEEIRTSMADLRNDRDEWRNQAQRLASESRTGILARIFGR